MIVTWSFLTLLLCYFAVYVDLVIFQCHGRSLESRLCLKTGIMFLIPSFYCPVSVMPTLALLFERVIGSQMYNFIAPFIPQNQYGFVKGTGAQDCGTTIAFTATQALNRQQECYIVSLDIKGAFDRIWWNGLLNHL